MSGEIWDLGYFNISVPQTINPLNVLALATGRFVRSLHSAKTIVIDNVIIKVFYFGVFLEE
jgi:hypothetical protein